MRGLEVWGVAGYRQDGELRWPCISRNRPAWSRCFCTGTFMRCWFPRAARG